jgi:uncharacterized protein
MIPAVLDTNVLVSGLLTPEGLPGRIVDLLLAGEVQPVFDDRIWLEYQHVLLRPRFGFRREDITEFLNYLEAFGQMVSPPPLPDATPDPKDQPFLEAAAAAGCPLVTGNMRHFPPEITGIAGVLVLTPVEFIQRFTG